MYLPLLVANQYLDSVASSRLTLWFMIKINGQMIKINDQLIKINGQIIIIIKNH